MYEFAPRLARAIDSLYRPWVRYLHRRLGLSPNHLTWASFAFSLATASAIASRHTVPGLALMALGQFLDGCDGALARHFGLGSEAGRRLDTAVDRASETVIFVGFALSGIVSWRLVLLALTAVLLLTTIVDRSGFDPGFKRFPLYLGLFAPYPLLFQIIFSVNLGAYVVGLIILDCRFQLRMDALGGDLDTVASRAAAAERSGG